MNIMKHILAYASKFLGTQGNQKKHLVKGNSKRVQFPINEKLDDGRHRYFLKFGVVVDRLS